MAAEAVAAAGLDERERTNSLLPTPAERGQSPLTVLLLSLLCACCTPVVVCVVVLLSSTSGNAITASVPSQQATLVQPLEPILGVAPLGRVQLTKDRKHQQTMLDAAFMHLPLPADCERVRWVTVSRRPLYHLLVRTVTCSQTNS